MEGYDCPNNYCGIQVKQKSFSKRHSKFKIFVKRTTIFFYEDLNNVARKKISLITDLHQFKDKYTSTNLSLILSTSNNE